MNFRLLNYTAIVFFTLQITTCKSGGFLRIDSLPKKELKSITLPKNSFLKTGILPAQVVEASGLAVADEQNFWTHNDDGIPVLYCIDKKGTLIRTLYLNNLNKGWEDLARDKEGNLYIGVFGNNKNERKDLKILIVKNPESVSEKIHTAEIINFMYEDQTEFPPPPQKRNFDADALIAYKDSLLIFTKNRTVPFSGYTKVYRLPKSPGNHTAVLVDSIYLGAGPMMDEWITGSDISPDGTKIALLGHSTVWLVTKFKEGPFSKGSILKINLPNYTHKAGIAFTSETDLFIVDEKEFGVLGGDLYHLNLKEIIGLYR